MVESSSGAGTSPKSSGTSRNAGSRSIALLRAIAINGLIVLIAVAVYYFAILNRQRQFTNDRAYRALGEVAQQIDNRVNAIGAFYNTTNVDFLEETLAPYTRKQTINLDELRPYLNLSGIRGFDTRLVDRKKDTINPCEFIEFSSSCDSNYKPFIQLTGSGGLLKMTIRLFKLRADSPYPLAFDLPEESLIDSPDSQSDFDEVLVATPNGDTLTRALRTEDQSEETERVQREIRHHGGAVHVADILVAAHRALWSQQTSPAGSTTEDAQDQKTRIRPLPTLDQPPGFNTEVPVQISGRDYKAYIRPYRPLLPLYRSDPLDNRQPDTHEPATTHGDDEQAGAPKPITELYMIGLKRQDLLDSASANLGARTNWYLFLLLAATLGMAPILRLYFQERNDAISLHQARLIRCSMVLLPSLLILVVLSFLASRALILWADRGAGIYAHSIENKLRGNMVELVRMTTAFDQWYQNPNVTSQPIFNPPNGLLTAHLATSPFQQQNSNGPLLLDLFPNTSCAGRDTGNMEKDAKDVENDAERKLVDARKSGKDIEEAESNLKLAKSDLEDAKLDALLKKNAFLTSSSRLGAVESDIDESNKMEQASKPLPPSIRQISFARLQYPESGHQEHPGADLKNWSIFTASFRADAQGHNFGVNLTSFRCKDFVKNVIDISTREYFTALRDEKGWPIDRLIFHASDLGLSDGSYVAQRLFNKQDGIKQLQIAIPRLASTQEVNRNNETKNSQFLGITSLASEMYAFSAAVQPLFYRFAVIYEDNGTVVFHTDDRRSLVENFKIETANTPELLGAIQARREGSFAGTYYGESSHFYYLPLDFAPWGIVVIYPDDVLGSMILFAGLTTLLIYLLVVLGTLVVGVLFIFPRQARMTWLWPQWSKRNRYPILVAWIVLHIAAQVLIFACPDGLRLYFALGIDAIGMLSGIYVLLAKTFAFQRVLPIWRAAIACVSPVILIFLELYRRPHGHWSFALCVLCISILAFMWKIWSCHNDGQDENRDQLTDRIAAGGEQALHNDGQDENRDQLSWFMKKLVWLFGVSKVGACKLVYLAAMTLFLFYVSVVPTAGLFLTAMNEQEEATVSAGLLQAATSFRTRVFHIGLENLLQTNGRANRRDTLEGDFPSALAISTAVGAPGFTICGLEGKDHLINEARLDLNLNLLSNGDTKLAARRHQGLTDSVWGLIATVNKNESFRHSLDPSSGESQSPNPQESGGDTSAESEGTDETVHICDVDPKLSDDGIHASPQVPSLETRPYVERKNDKLIASRQLFGNQTVSVAMKFPPSWDAYILKATPVGDTFDLILTFFLYVLEALLLIIGVIALLHFVARRLLALDLLEHGSRDNLLELGLGEETADAAGPDPSLLMNVIGSFCPEQIPASVRPPGFEVSKVHCIDLVNDDLDRWELRSIWDREQWLLLLRLDTAMMDPAKRPQLRNWLDRLLACDNMKIWVTTLVDPMQRLANPEEYPETERSAISEGELACWSELLARFRREFGPYPAIEAPSLEAPSLLIGVNGSFGPKQIPVRARPPGFEVSKVHCIDLVNDDLDSWELRSIWDREQWLLLLRLDTAMMDPAKRPQLKIWLDRLLACDNMKIWVTTSIHPIRCLANPKEYPETERSAWSELLAPFHREFGPYPAIELKNDLDQYIVDEIRVLRGAWAEELRTSIIDLHYKQNRFRTKEDVQLFVVSHARARFQRYWLTCSFDERLALYQLARGKLLNPINEDVIAQLLRRGYVVMDPHVLLASETFRRFILDAETKEKFEHLTQIAQQGLWQTLRTPLFVVLMLLIAFVAYSSGDAFKAITAVLAGTLTFLGQGFQALRILKGGKSGNDE